MSEKKYIVHVNVEFALDVDAKNKKDARDTAVFLMMYEDMNEYRHCVSIGEIKLASEK